MVNKVILIGNLGADPEIVNSRDGGKFATMSLATSEKWTDKTTGDKRERTEWHRIVIFAEPLVRLAETYLRKGMKLYVEGQNQTRKWTDQNGADRWTTEVVLAAYRGEIHMLSSAGGGRPDNPSGPDDYGSQSRGDTRTYDRPADGPGRPKLAHETGGLDDEIPF